MRSLCRSSLPELTSASPLRKSTGKTQGMRFSSSPPRNASAVMRASARNGESGAAGTQQPCPASPQCRNSRAVRTAPARLSIARDSAARFASFLSSRIKPLAVGVSFCGAGLSRMFWSAGKNTACVSRWPVSTASRKPSAVGWKTALSLAGSGLGSAFCPALQHAQSTAELESAGGVVGRTWSLTSSSALPGMQTSRQTSQSTLAWRVAGPSFTVSATVELDREKHFILVAEIHERAERQPAGRGKLHGSGGDCRRASVHLICGGSPESPAFFQ